MQFFRQSFQERPRQRDEIAAHRSGEPQDGRPQPHASVRRGGDHQLLGFERGDDALHGRAREFHALRDLAEAEAGVLVLERAQDRGGARDDLHLALFVGDETIAHRRFHPWTLTRRIYGRLASWDTIAQYPIQRKENSAAAPHRRSRRRETHGPEDRTRRTFPVARPDRLLAADHDRGRGRRWSSNCSSASRTSANCGCRPWTRPASRARCCRSPARACRPSAMPRSRRARRARRTISWLWKSRSGRTAMRASPTSRCRTRRPPPTSSSAACASLKFCGAMINGHTNGQYLDDPVALSVLGTRRGAGRARSISTRPIRWRRRRCSPACRRCAAPPGNGASRPARTRCAWCSAGCSTASRRRASALGHMGETLPYLLWRFDSRAKLYGVKLAKAPSEYIKDNIVVTVSGMYAAEPLRCALDALGRDKVMFAADYPFESAEEAGALHGYGRARRGRARRCGVQQRGEVAGSVRRDNERRPPSRVCRDGGLITDNDQRIFALPRTPAPAPTSGLTWPGA